MRSSGVKKNVRRSTGTAGRRPRGSHARVARGPELLARLRDRFLRPQNIVYFLIFATFCFCLICFYQIDKALCQIDKA